MPINGPPSPGLEAFDGVMVAQMARWGLTGGALALTKDGRLVFDRAYGWADREANEPWRPDSLCRIASDSGWVDATLATREQALARALGAQRDLDA